MTQECQNCRFFNDGKWVDAKGVAFGECRRDPPRLFAEAIEVEAAFDWTPSGTQLVWRTFTDWPNVERDEWCGRWEKWDGRRERRERPPQDPPESEVGS